MSICQASSRILCSALIWLSCMGAAGADRAPYGGTEDLTAYSQALTVRHHHDWGRFQQDRSSQDHDGFVLKFSANAPFGIDAAHSSLEFLDGQGRLIKRMTSPPLTHLWVAPDSRYVVGLSRIKLANDVQLVVLDRDGTLLLSRHIAAEVHCMSLGDHARLRDTYPRAFAELDRFSRYTHLSYAWRQGETAYLDLIWQSSATAPLFEGLAAPCRSPYSPNITESVSNFVYWYHADDPAPRVVVRADRPVAVRVRDPKGIEMSIPIALAVLPGSR